MKLRHEVTIVGQTRRANDHDPNAPVQVTLRLAVEGIRGEPIVGSIEAALRQTGQTIRESLDRRPY